MGVTQQLKQHACDLGFSSIGICPAVTPTGLHEFAAWLDAGYDGEMRYLRDRQHAYAHPQHILVGVRSLVMLGLNYGTETPSPIRAGQGRVSRYAWGEVDYHDLIHAKLKALKRFLQQEDPAANVRGVVDTAPLLEREFARLAGLGWVGKHTLLLNRTQGSWFFLAALLTDQELEYDVPETEEYCGSCTACLDACPTGAFPQPYVLDATQCISYLNIELRGAVPHDLRHGIGEWLFGCDICQEVCPWNRQAPQSSETGLRPRADQDPVELATLFGLSDDAFRDRFRKTPLWRAKRRGILRNAALVLGNQKHAASFVALCKGLHDVEPVVRSASAWALGQIGGPAASTALQARLVPEENTQVIAEIEFSLSILGEGI